MKKLREIISILKSHLGMSVSVSMHLFLFILLLASFPQCHKKLQPEIIVSIDLLPVGKITNIENKQVKKPKAKEEPIKTHKKQKDVVENKPEPKPTEKQEQKKNIDPKKEVIKKKKEVQTPKKEEKKKKKPKQDNDIDNVLKNLEALEKQNDIEEELAEKRSKGPYNSELALSISVKDAIKKQIEQNWNPPAGNKDAGKLEVLLKIIFKRDGSVANVKIIDNYKYNNNDLYRVAADSAVRAVYKASPLRDLPADQYNSWKELEFNFDPSGILGD
ncbi:MAG: TonB C-terminal domain-containing protein [Pseudomonadota bacterium]